MAKMHVKCALLRNHSKTVQRNKEKELKLIKEENEKQFKTFSKKIEKQLENMGEENGKLKII